MEGSKCLARRIIGIACDVSYRGKQISGVLKKYLTRVSTFCNCGVSRDTTSSGSDIKPRWIVMDAAYFLCNPIGNHALMLIASFN